MRNNKILIVEDENNCCQYLDAVIKISNSENKTFFAKNGKEAVDICKTNKDINLVFMDIKMPIMNGCEATKQIKEINPNIPVIAQTAFASNIIKNDAISAGCSEFITKPINIETIFSLINRYLDKQC